MMMSQVVIICSNGWSDTYSITLGEKHANKPEMAI